MGFLFKSKVSFVEGALGTNLLKFRLLFLDGQFELAQSLNFVAVPVLTSKDVSFYPEG